MVAISKSSEAAQHNNNMLIERAEAVSMKVSKKVEVS